MSSSKETLGELWARQQIADRDVDYALWAKLKANNAIEAINHSSVLSR